MARPLSRARGALLALALHVVCLVPSVGGALAAAAPLPTPPGPAPAFDAPLAFAPLDTPLTVAGGFAEYRIGHFHAGFDFGTGSRVGKPVRAPLSGHLARIRASGVGYGRSLYLQTTDGRLIQFGHLDAFVAPVASWVDSIQRATGQYEQDLWPDASRFPIRAGERIAWTGQSGSGGPHLHFEIRRGDTAFHPQRAGLVIADDSPPSFATLTLDPLDDASYVAGRPGPVTFDLGAAPETLRVLGRVRAVIGARDGVWRGVDRMVPWLTRLTWGDAWLECRMDSISWATDMNEGDYVYDAGRIVGDKGLVMWAPPGWRPKFFRTNVPKEREAGTIAVQAGDPPRLLRLLAQDASGNAAVRDIVIAPLAARDVPANARRPRAGDGRTIKSSPVVPFRVGTATPDGAGLSATQLAAALRNGTWAWTLPADATFEAESLVVAVAGPKLREQATGLVPIRSLGEILPRTTPFRRTFTLHIPKSMATRSDRVGLYRYGSDGWDLVSWSERKDGLGWDADSRRPGRFALFADTTAPAINLLPAPKLVRGESPYATWAVEAELREVGSGVNARGCYFLLDDRRMPVEWDPEASALRWRPLKPPAPGRYRLTAVAADRAGNVRRASRMLEVP